MAIFNGMAVNYATLLHNFWHLLLNRIVVCIENWLKWKKKRDKLTQAEILHASFSCIAANILTVLITLYDTFYRSLAIISRRIQHQPPRSNPFSLMRFISKVSQRNKQNKESKREMKKEQEKGKDKEWKGKRVCNHNINH